MHIEDMDNAFPHRLALEGLSDFYSLPMKRAAMMEALYSRPERF